MDYLSDLKIHIYKLNMHNSFPPNLLPNGKQYFKKMLKNIHFMYLYERVNTKINSACSAFKK